MPLSGARYRYKKGTKIRLAFKDGKVVEAKNMKTGKTHTPLEFKDDQTKESSRKQSREGKVPCRVCGKKHEGMHGATYQ